jgi:hypothetical protein
MSGNFSDLLTDAAQPGERGSGGELNYGNEWPKLFREKKHSEIRTAVNC